MKSAIWIYCNEAFILRLKVLFVCFLYISFQLGLHVKDIFVGNTSVGGSCQTYFFANSIHWLYM